MLKQNQLIIYAQEDSGRDFPHLGVFLQPGVPIVAGEIGVEFADRLVEEGICALYTEPEPAETEEVPTEPSSAASVTLPVATVISSASQVTAPSIPIIAAPAVPPLTAAPAATDASGNLTDKVN